METNKNKVFFKFLLIYLILSINQKILIFKLLLKLNTFPRILFNLPYSSPVGDMFYYFYEKACIK